MAEDAPEPRKRSRFDVGPPGEEPPARRSRFDVGASDRRSRSPDTPDARRNDRERTPISTAAKSTETADGDTNKAKDAAARAAEAAAKINAQLQSKKPIQQVDVPPIRQSPAADPKSPSTDPAPSGMLNAEIYQQDGDFIRDIEVNDLRNRYTLTKGSTQKMNPPLYLHVTSTTKDGLEKAVEKINELMKQELPNLIDERRFRKPREEQPQVERDHLGRRKWPEERIPIDLEPIPGFNLRAQVVGSGGSYVKHIQQETRCRVQIKGRGSGFIEHDTGHESDEQMYLHVAGPEQAMVDAAKEQCLSLLESVKESYEAFKERGPPNRGGYGGEQRGGYRGHSDRQNSGSYGGGSGYGGGSAYGGNGDSSYGAYGQNYGQGYGQGYGQQGYGGAQSPVAAQAQSGDPAEQMNQHQAWAAYYAANPSEDPWAAYGGYGAMLAHAMQPQAYSQTPANGAAPPPPPPDDGNLPPPPPPPGADGGSYNAVSLDEMSSLKVAIRLTLNQVPPPPGV
ncbi:hypothetical protein PRZ48_012398 [Zasmidium cellare]|uniref:K Homology domain-containing protein n=1 Tax=Zasmidium cellare TaxID=395010 RepID=A0ABR0E578_ZASCE|nr:hypothetical protein PRZ48_012398 [Zasmidium cellare]